MQFIINTIISLSYAVIVAIISSTGGNVLNAEALHFALFDFFMVQIFYLL